MDKAQNGSHPPPHPTTLSLILHFEPASECWCPLVAWIVSHSLPEILGRTPHLHRRLLDTQLLLTECPTCKGPECNRVVLSAILLRSPHHLSLNLRAGYGLEEPG